MVVVVSKISSGVLPPDPTDLYDYDLHQLWSLVCSRRRWRRGSGRGRFKSFSWCLFVEEHSNW